MDSGIDKSKRSYVLVSAAHNEEANIEKTLGSIVMQTVLPERWVIVSDNSTDRTDEIIQNYEKQHGFIKFVRVIRPPGHSFAAKILALREGSKHLDGLEYSFIGNLDADIELKPTYFEELLNRMEASPSLGIAAGYVYEELDGQFQSRAQNRDYSVAHAAQLVRRECYEAIGGYAVLKYGGEDTHATASARMKGWQVQSFPDLRIYHQRHTGSGTTQLRAAFRQGRMEYDLGNDILFEIMKCISRMREQPVLLGGMARMLGFAWSHIKGDKRPVDKEFVSFVRSQQRQRLLSMIGRRNGEKQRQRD